MQDHELPPNPMHFKRSLKRNPRFGVYRSSSHSLVVTPSAGQSILRETESPQLSLHLSRPPFPSLHLSLPPSLSLSLPLSLSLSCAALLPDGRRWCSGFCPWLPPGDAGNARAQMSVLVSHVLFNAQLQMHSSSSHV